MNSVSSLQTLTSNLPVPFDPSVSLFHIPVSASISQGSANTSPTPGSNPLILPAVSCSKEALHRLSFSHGIRPFLHAQLDVSRLNKIHDHLWMVGKPRPGRPLHQHIIAGRRVACTEQTDMHLLIEDARIFVKPCPDWLLSHDFWERHLCGHEAAWQTAVGLLYSYAWLIRDKSDWRVAHAEGVLSDTVSWEDWTALMAQFMAFYGGGTMEARGLEMNPRFMYGTLRLPRIQTIYRFCSGTGSCLVMINGYHNAYPSYRAFFVSNIGPISAATIYLALILGAMQVGLSTDRLQRSDTFQGASLFVSLLAIIGPLLCILALVLVAMGYVFVFNLQHAMSERRAVRARAKTSKAEP